MKQINKIAIITGCFLYCFIAIMQSTDVYADKTAYTIQTGSFLIEADAMKQYDLVMNALNEIERDHLRIEKIGKYYSLRLGQFDDHVSTEALFDKVKKIFSTAIVMNAYIKEERIIKSYGVLVKKKTDIINAKKSPGIFYPKGLIYTIQTGSFSKEITAKKQFDLILRKLASSDLAYLRIEKIGKFFCLRVGNFKTRKTAVPVFVNIKEIIPKAVIVDAYIKESRIEKLYNQAAFVSNEAGQAIAAKERINPDDKHGSIKDIHGTGQEETVSKHLEESEDQKDHDLIDNEATASVQDGTMADLFFSDKKPLITSNLQKKIRPNSERKGDKYISKKQYFNALEEYRKAPYKRPILRRKLAMLLYKLGFIDEAIVEIKEVIKSSPAASYDRMMLGTLFLAKGSESEAKEQFIASLVVNPGNTYGYRYLAELFLRERNYEMAWLSVKMARHLGYKGDGLISRLNSLSAEPEIDPVSIDKEGMSLRLILVNTPGKAREIVDRIFDGELFEEIAGKESIGPGRNAGGFMGKLSPEEVGSEIAEAMHNQTAFAEPIIVKTSNGYHIVQRIAPFDISLWKKLVDNSKEKRVPANRLK